MAHITHPRPKAGQQNFIGIDFHDGFADVDNLHPEVRASLAQHGFTIDETPELREKTVAELRAELEDLGYDVKTSWKKAELVERIAQHHDLNTEKFAIVEQPDGTIVGDGTSLATLPATRTRSTEYDDIFESTDAHLADLRERGIIPERNTGD